MGLFYNDGSTLTNTSCISFIRGSGAPDGAMVFVTNQNERLRIQSDGKIGIGTNTVTDSNVFVEVVGSASQLARLQFDNKPVIGSNNGEIGGILFRNNADSVGYIQCMRESAADDAYIRFGTQATGGGVTERLRITSGGFIGMGGNTNPTNVLHIKTAVTNTAVATIESTATNSYPFLRLKNDAREYQLTCHGGLSDAFTIYDGTSSAHRFLIDSNGKVSIASGAYGGGGAVPELYVKGTSGRQMKIHNSNAGTSSLQITNGTTGEGEDAGTQLFTQGSTGDFYISNQYASGDIAFNTRPSGGSNAKRLTISSDGYLIKGTGLTCAFNVKLSLIHI